MDTVGKLLQGQSVWWQQVAVSVDHTVTLDVVFHDDEVTHAEGLYHHLVEFGMGTSSGDDVTACQPDEEPHDAHQYQDAEGGVKPVEVHLLLDAFGVEPAILDGGDLTTLLQARILVVDLLDKLAVTTYDMYLRDGDTDIVEYDTLQVEFLDFPLQGLLAPHVVFVVAVEQA